MSKSREQGKVEEFACALEESFPGAHNGNACDWWENFNNATFSIFSRKTNKTADWFDSHTEEMTLTSEGKKESPGSIQSLSHETKPAGRPSRSQQTPHEKFDLNQIYSLQVWCKKSAHHG